jgi:hypothetical protein
MTASESAFPGAKGTHTISKSWITTEEGRELWRRERNCRRSVRANCSATSSNEIGVSLNELGRRVPSWAAACFQSLIHQILPTPRFTIACTHFPTLPTPLLPARHVTVRIGRCRRKWCRSPICECPAGTVSMKQPLGNGTGWPTKKATDFLVFNELTTESGTDLSHAGRTGHREPA